MRAIRPAAVAGSFYPAEPRRLAATVDGFLADADGGDRAARPRALIAPHAGYVYSGATAGRAFATLGGDAAGIRRVVVIGPAHFVRVRGLALPTAEAFRTPLGDVPVDPASRAAARALPQVIVADLPHLEEHALEVELPFLQRRLGAFMLVPLVVGDATPDEVAAVLDAFWDDATLIVVSSDLSHYLDHHAARHRDSATAAMIERLDGRSLGPDDACGFLAVAGLLALARRRGLAAVRLGLCTSGETAGTRDSVVGYGAWAFA